MVQQAVIRGVHAGGRPDRLGRRGGTIAAAILVLLTRPRVRVGPPVSRCETWSRDRLIPWSNVVDVSFPRASAGPVDLEAYEYVPLVAVQAVDRERAVSAMDTMRQLMARYRPGPGRPPD